MTDKWLFNSFFLGGFECSTHLSPEGHRLDVIAATQHDKLARQDYELCLSAGVRAVRESARWPINDHAGKLELEGIRQLARLGKELGIIQVWDLMHYGYPDDLDPFGPYFTERLAAFARAVAVVVREETEGPTYFTPINEISYNAFAASIGYMAPYVDSRGEYKRILVSASIAAANAIWEVDPTATIFNVDPLVRLHAPKVRPDLQSEADHFNKHVVTEAFDMLAGRIAPELGGSRAHLGIAGFNYYASNQWTIATPELPQRFLEPDDLDWIHVGDMLAEMEARYGGPVVLAETGASGEERGPWLRLLTSEAQRARAMGVNLQGICLYPIITSPDWEDPTAFFDGGLFDIEPQVDGRLGRTLSVSAAQALREAQVALDPENVPATPLPPDPRPAADPPLQVSHTLSNSRSKGDNFAYDTLFAGEGMVVAVYHFRPGGSLPPHRHAAIEHVLTVLVGEGTFYVGSQKADLKTGDSIFISPNTYFSISNISTEVLVVQQVSTPKPWDSRFSGPHPSNGFTTH